MLSLSHAIGICITLGSVTTIRKTRVGSKYNLQIYHISLLFSPASSFTLCIHIKVLRSQFDLQVVLKKAKVGTQYSIHHNIIVLIMILTSSPVMQFILAILNQQLILRSKLIYLAYTNKICFREKFDLYIVSKTKCEIYY